MSPDEIQHSLSLYIHVPWCIKKCPYCDFNSHKLKDNLPETAYIDRLIEDLTCDARYAQNRTLKSIFIGGGTPSLLSAQGYERLFNAIDKQLGIDEHCEITLEANPGTFEQQRFCDYRKAGINRLSIGAQSFDSAKLKALGRIHDADEAIRAVAMAEKAGFENFNLDLMFALPEQTPAEALADLQIALDLNPTHLSWYQLTLEPNTVFHKYPPKLPEEDSVVAMLTSGWAMLAQKGYHHYEVSAFAKNKNFCKHNLNYWHFGDYIGIGAGAHGKITDLKTLEVFRTHKYKLPRLYLEKPDALAEKTSILQKELPFEFMLNVLRLQQPVSYALFEKTTGMQRQALLPILQQAGQKGLVNLTATNFNLTELGRRFLDDVVAMFLDAAD